MTRPTLDPRAKRAALFWGTISLIVWTFVAGLIGGWWAI